jgi:hypothetical protein
MVKCSICKAKKLQRSKLSQCKGLAHNMTMTPVQKVYNELEIELKSYYYAKENIPKHLLKAFMYAKQALKDTKEENDFNDPKHWWNTNWD